MQLVSGYTKTSFRVRFRAEIMVALFALSQQIYIHFIGRMMLAELIAIVGIFLINKKKLIQASPYLRKILLGYSILLIGLIVSDIYNESVPQDFARGWSIVIFGVITTLFLTDTFLKSSRAIYIYLIFSTLSSIFFFQTEGLLMSIDEGGANYFKAHLVPMIFPAVVLFVSIFWNYKYLFLSVILLAVSGMIFVLFGARSSGAGLIVASVLLLMQVLNFRLRPAHVFIAASLFLVTAYSGYAYYVNKVLNHGFGDGNALQLLKLENPYNPLELLLEGRASTVVATEAIGDRPLLGFGSWAKDETNKYGDFYAYLREKDNFVHPLGIIPVHSVILAAWVWSGIIGFLGMLKVATTMYRAFLVSFLVKSSLSPVINVYFIASMWAILFSPIGHIRTSLPFIIALLIASSYKCQGSQSGDSNQNI